MDAIPVLGGGIDDLPQQTIAPDLAVEIDGVGEVRGLEYSGLFGVVVIVAAAYVLAAWLGRRG